MDFDLILFLLLIYLITIIIDYLTGTAVAIKKKTWSSATARSGLWKKCGSIICVLATGLADACFYGALEHIPTLESTFDYTIMFMPLVIIWFITTDIGSIVENASEMGANVPNFFKKSISTIISKQDKDNKSQKKR